ncbi:hypothetical protein GCM10023340_15400 [Nocardioides marinquilinus]|uniref:Lipoprotein LpqN n=1 Tax=Nocardioides marinquilinus TaxID=1210400 RepID=A0ABP9PK51_9ACTN
MLTLTALLAACGDDEPSDGPSADGSGPTTASSDGTEPTGPTGPTEPTEPTEPGGSSGASDPTGTGEPPETDPPAEGTTVELDDLSFVLPDLYEVNSQSGGTLVAGRKGVATPSEKVLIATTFVGSTATLESFYRQHLRVAAYTGKPSRLPDVEIDGVPMYHVEGPLGSLIHQQAFGGVANENYFSLELVFADDFPAEREQALVEAIIGSVEFTP